MIYNILLLKAGELSTCHLYVCQDVKLALVCIRLRFDVLEGHVDDRHHHVDQDHVDADGENKENPCSHFVGGPETGKVELANGHGQGVLHTAVRLFEVDEVGAKDEEEEADKGAKDDAKLDDKGAKTNEAKPDGCRNLPEGFCKADNELDQFQS